MRLYCPHCMGLGTVRTHGQVSDTVSQCYVQCTNFECGHTWRATIEADVTLSPSATPNPRVNLPLSSHVRRDLLKTQLDNQPDSPYLPTLTPPVSGDLFAGGGPA